MTGLWAFEGQMPYQNYQGPPIVVRYQMVWHIHHKPEEIGNSKGLQFHPKDKSSSGSQVLPPFKSITSDFWAKLPTIYPVVTRSFAKDKWYLKKRYNLPAKLGSILLLEGAHWNFFQ